MVKNKRRFIRVGLQTSTTCSLLDPSGVGNRAIDVTLVDLSAGGAALVATEPAVVGRPVRLAVHSANPEIDITVIGTVVRADARAADGQYRFAVRFVALPDPERVALTRFVLKAARTNGQGADLIVPGAAA
jgi:c-di-GMP-binding flagellar brake protein YcgR